MQYGYFDDAAKEYVITRPDTPKSWSNYLGSTEYGAIVTNNAGGYSFYTSGAQGRFVRLRFNAVPMDQPGRYIYLRDMDTGDFWSASWQPVGKPLDAYKCVCRHGCAYTVIASDYDGIHAETTYFVPLGALYEVWQVRLVNTGKTVRRLKAFSYVEYAGNWSSANDLVNLQYSQHIVSMSVADGIIDHGTNVAIPANPDDFEDADQGRHSFLALVGAPVTGFDTDRAAFLGPYGSYARPAAVVAGATGGSLAAGDNGCGVLETALELAPGETKTFLFLMGVGRADREGREAAAAFVASDKAEEELGRLKSFWHARIAGIEAKTPDPAFNSMLAMWGPFNAQMTFAWSRAASLIYAGERDGLGYRDTVQDMLGVLHAIPEEAGRRLELMLTGQVSTGGAMPVVKPFAHRPGAEMPPREEEYRSDDSLWLFVSVPEYVKETGDLGFFRKVLPYADHGEDSVLGHLKRAIAFSLARVGAHGLPCGLSADWNDCIRMGSKGETVFVAFQLRYALQVYAEICRRLSETAEAVWAEERLDAFDAVLTKWTWDGEWYVRAFGADASKFGSRECPEGQIFLNVQSWAILCGHAEPERARRAMEAVASRLATEYGLMICDPPFVKTDYTIMRAALFNPGMKENASIFTHTQFWAVMAETMLGHGNRAWTYYRATLPSAWNDRAEVREIEPYVYCQYTHSKYSPRFGASRVPWLSGSAAWSYYAATHYILGVRPEYDGVRFDPCIPAVWDGFTVCRRFRGADLHVEVRNPDHVQKGVRRFVVNGTCRNGNFLPASEITGETHIVVEMG